MKKLILSLHHKFMLSAYVLKTIESLLTTALAPYILQQRVSQILQSLNSLMVLVRMDDRFPKSFSAAIYKVDVIACSFISVYHCTYRSFLIKRLL